MTETVKERIYRGALETMSDSDFMGNKYVKKFVKGVFKQIEDVPGTTDKLSVENLQEQLNTAKKALTSIKWRTERDELETYYVERNHDIHKDAIEALAAIGGDDDNRGNSTKLPNKVVKDYIQRN